MIPAARATPLSAHSTTGTGLCGLAVGRFADFGFSGGGSSGWTYTATITGLTPEMARVPEPSTLILLGSGLLVVAYYERRKWNLVQFSER
jgi:hypothetical protein